jgi:hypothetical protein
VSSDPEQIGPTVVVPVRSRWRRSEVTFGPIGRVLATAAVVVPMVFMLLFSVFFLVAGLLLMPVALMALKQIWRPVQIGEVRLPAPIAPDQPTAPSIMDRDAPQRW